MASFLLAAAPLPASALDRECLARLRLAEGTGFVRSYRDAGERLEVIVSEEIRDARLLPSGRGFIRTLNYAPRREGKDFPRIVIRSDASEEVIAEARGDDFAAR